MYFTACFPSLWEQVCLIQAYFTFCGVWVGRKNEIVYGSWQGNRERESYPAFHLLFSYEFKCFQYKFTLIL